MFCLLVGVGRGLDDGAAAAHDGDLGRGLGDDGGTGEESGHLEGWVGVSMEVGAVGGMSGGRAEEESTSSRPRQSNV